MSNERSNKGPVFTGTAAAVGTIPADLRSVLVLAVSGLSTETVNLTASVDGGATYETAKLRPIDLSTGALFASGDLANGLYRIDVTGISAVKVTKSAGAESVTVKTGFWG